MNVPIFLLQDMDGAKQHKRRLHILEIYANPAALTIKKIRFHIFYDTLLERKIQLLAKWKKGYKLLKKHKQFYRRKVRDENPIV